MTEQLPISIYVCDDLKQHFVKINSVCNKLEAQFNFQTMTANWYSDEDNVCYVQLYIETPQGFVEQQKRHQQVDTQIHCDDVFSYDVFCSDGNNKKKQTLVYCLALTESELALLNQQTKILAGLLQAKLQKILNLIAKQLQCSTI